MPGLDFVDESQQAVKLSVGGDFEASGFISAWKGEIGYAFWTETDLAALVAAGDAPKPDHGRVMGRGFKYFYRSKEANVTASEICGQKYPGKQTWLFLSDRDKVLNIGDEEIIARFSDPIWMDLEISTLRSGKDRHQFHMIALPAWVAAIAKLLGFDNPGFSLHELLTQDVIYTDEFQEQMIGHPDKNNWSESLLWKRRAELWAALGEPDAAKFQPIGMQTKFDTTSEKLSKCLNAAVKPWKAPIWARLVPVATPVVDGTYKNSKDDSKRLTIPAITEIFASQAEAQAIATKEIEARKKASGDGASAKPANGSKQVPTAWAETPNEWPGYVKELMAPLAGKPRPVVVKYLKEHESEIGATPEEVLAWA